MRNLLLTWLLAWLCSSVLPAQVQTAGDIQLPAPQTEGGKPLMQSLRERKSERAFATTKLPEQVLSNLLWAACGISRPDGRRTAPTAMNRQEIDVYVVLQEGAFLYEPKEHVLKRVSTADLRPLSATQDYAKEAPVNLVYVADTAKMGELAEQNKALFYAADTGFISQNVYLYCASEGLATVVRASVDRPSLAQALSLRPEQRIVLAQSVGYRK